LELKQKIKDKLREVYGTFDTYLEIEYENLIIEKLLNDNWSHKRKWATYNQLVLELKNNIKNMLKVRELQYSLTEDVLSKSRCLNIIEDIKNDSPELTRLYEKISNF
jgi:hypothetical protein